jgi:hypothetical protein
MSERSISAAPAGQLRLAGLSTLAGVAMLLAGTVAVSLFFANVAYVFGPISDVAFALAMFLLLPAVWAVHRITRGATGTLFAVVSALAAGGMVVSGVGSLALVVRLIDLQTSFVTFGLGMFLFVVWALAVGAVALRTSLLSASIGWWVAAFAAATVIGTIGWLTLPPALAYAGAVVLLVTWAAWLVALGRDLLRRA